jgi:hypothetical protein
MVPRQANLDFVNIAFWASRHESSLAQQSTIRKGLWIMFTQMFGDLQRFHHWEVNIILLPLLMIFPGKFGCTA